MKILGVNISHNASICQMTDGKIDFYYEEDRFRKNQKNYDPNFFKEGHIEYVSISKHAKEKYDFVGYASFDRRCNHAFEDQLIISSIAKQLNTTNNIFEIQHHLYHAYCGFHFSEFDEAICLVLDGGGAMCYEELIGYQEIESIYTLKKNLGYKCHYKHLTNNNTDIFKINDEINEINIDEVEVQYSSQKSSGQKFSSFCDIHLNGSGYDAGKAMGMSSYAGTDQEWPVAKEAAELQNETCAHTIELIKKAMSYSKCKNIILSGGYALNCVNNYKYVEAFPELNFFIDPVAHDGGTAIGIAAYLTERVAHG